MRYSRRRPRSPTTRARYGHQIRTDRCGATRWRSRSTLDIFRFDEAVDERAAPRHASTSTFPTTMTVLDALEYAKAEVDGSISFRRSCRSAICGSCSMNINGMTGLACKTPVDAVLREDDVGHGRPDAELPAHEGPGRPHGPVLGQVLAPQAVPAARRQGLATTRRERRVSPEDMKKLVAVANCVMCATCYSLCPVVSVDPAFAGPAAIAYAYRFIEDVRDSKRKERAAQISDDYLWLCAHCYACSYCPKHVDPHDRIIDTSSAPRSRKASSTQPGPRHALVVAKTIKRPACCTRPKSSKAPSAASTSAACSRSRRSACAWRRSGKIPPLFLKPVPKVDEIRTIFDTLEAPVLA